SLFNLTYTVGDIRSYDFLASETGMSLPASVFGESVVNHENTTIRTRGLATGSRVKVLGTGDWTVSVTGYDKKGRAIYGKSKNGHLGTVDVTETAKYGRTCFRNPHPVYLIPS